MKIHLKPKLINLMQNSGLCLYSAARIIGVNPATVWRWRHTDDIFARKIVEVRALQHSQTIEAQFEALKVAAASGEVQCRVESE